MNSCLKRIHRGLEVLGKHQFSLLLSLASSRVTDQESLRELVLLEDFKNCLPDRLAVYLNECKVTTLSQAAVLADEFVLTHKSSFIFKQSSGNICDSSFKTTPPRKTRSPNRNMASVECFYCHKMGHIANECFALKRKHERQEKKQPPKGVGFAQSVSLETFVSPDECYRPFIFNGSVSLPHAEERGLPIVMLRDTGAAQSFIRAGVLPWSDETLTGWYALCQGSRLTCSFMMCVCVLTW